MSHILVHPCYFGSVAQFTAISQANEISFEACDNYQKQTYRNRTYIYGANGKLLLNIPILHSGVKGSKRLYKDIQIEHQFNSLKIHWKSFEAAYRTSPFFEFYEDEFAPLFENKEKFLMDFNLKCNEFVFDALGLDYNPQKTNEFNLKLSNNIIDYRELATSKSKVYNTEFEKYIQVFSDKHGFLSNLSVLDVLFNLGPSSLEYLENQKLELV